MGILIKGTEIFRRQALTVKTNFLRRRMRTNFKKQIEQNMQIEKELTVKTILCFLNTVKNNTYSILKDNLKIQKELMKKIESLQELIAKFPADQKLTKQLNETEESLTLCKKYNWFLNEVLLLKRPNTEGFHLEKDTKKFEEDKDLEKKPRGV